MNGPAPPEDSRAHFDTASLHADLRRRAVRGGAVTAAAQAGKAALQLGGVLALARLLTPEDFGMVAMVLAAAGVIEMFRNLGLPMATVQREDITHEQASALFWINFGLSAAAAVAVAAAAPALAWYYREPRLTDLTLVLAVSYFLGGVGLQHAALLRRQMRFGALAAIELAALAAGTAAAVVLAALGFGYWALAGQQVLAGAIAAAASWRLCSWRPGPPRRAPGVGALLSFGGHLTGFSVVNYFARNLDQVLLGRFYGPLAVGLYQRAYDVLMVPLRQINDPVASVAIPALSRIADQPERYRRTYLRILEKILMVTMPLAAFVVMGADRLVVLVFGDQWIESGCIVAALGAAIFTQPIGNSTGWLFISQNRVHHLFRWGLVGSGTAVVSFLIGLPWGAFGVALSYALVGLFVRKPLLIWYVTRSGPIRPMDILRVAASPALAAAAAGAALALLRQFGPAWGPAAGLGLSAAATVAVALGTLAALPAGRAALRDAAHVAADLCRRRLGPGAPGPGDGRT
jgi:PST family polysaccharide transporter